VSKHHLSAITFFMLIATTQTAFADPVCEQLAAEKRLGKAAKAGFIRKCEADQAGDLLAQCDRAASARSLQGATRNAEVKQCLSDRRKQS
jgi:hypothetical protein